MRRHQLAQMLLIGAIAAVIGVALALAIDWFPIQGSSEAKDIDTLYDVLLIASVPIFVLVQVIVLYCVWRFRMRPGQEEQDGPPIHGNTALEVIWTAIPALLIFGLCAYSLVVLADIEEDRDPMVVEVTGQQFAWSFAYPVEEGPPVQSDQLYLPEGEQIEFHVTSRDVVHDFWMPAMRLKIDGVPGITTEYKITPDRTGDYDVVCAELCGIGHSTMRSTAHVLEPAEFDAWLTEQQQMAGGPPGAPPGAPGAPAGELSAEAEQGKAVFESAGCNACHTLADAGSTATTGPDLDEVLPGRSPEFIRESIVDPSAELAEGFPDGVMPPNYAEQLTPEEIDQLVAYLAAVTGG